ncbi:Crp/Fnr family transcriptional regulator [Algoriphagus sp. NG3]|uniref:Crp/Fnr family transcriptional regulator n=1 Tax=Algoriphagus sp. NG3 TaxID=3097546 RepID=UPI002A82CF91|nr:Crp/Fnr family transcriptional regulator [Algoriphagus sp. NG3]WPR77215.1 Crp/Fnr family transcriptional regulator [Algoriphagus sp. NG3]
MDKLMEYLLHFGNLNPKQIGFISQKAKESDLQKGEFFSEAGKIARQVGFIIDGVIRFCHYTDTGEEITTYFMDENNFFVDLNSFDNRIPSTGYIQAVTDCKLIVFMQQDWQELSNSIVGWDKIVQKILSKSMLEKLDKINPLISEDATTRYLKFLEKYPKLINRIPLSYLASYLGITQSSLSRIRKSIT